MVTLPEWAFQQRNVLYNSGKHDTPSMQVDCCWKQWTALNHESTDTRCPPPKEELHWEWEGGRKGVEWGRDVWNRKVMGQGEGRNRPKKGTGLVDAAPTKSYILTYLLFSFGSHTHHRMHWLHHCWSLLAMLVPWGVWHSLLQDGSSLFSCLFRIFWPSFRTLGEGTPLPFCGYITLPNNDWGFFFLLLAVKFFFQFRSLSV